MNLTKLYTLNERSVQEIRSDESNQLIRIQCIMQSFPTNKYMHIKKMGKEASNFNEWRGR